MMSYDNWLNDSYIQKWFKALAERTRENYTERFPEWLAFIQMTPTDMIQKRIRDLQNSNPQVRGWFEDKVIEFKNALQVKFDNENTIKGYLTAVRSFFSKNRLHLQFGRGELKVEVDSKVVKKKWTPTNAEIRRMYDLAGVRDRALLLVLYQSGFSEIDIVTLNIQDIKNIYELPNEHYYIMKKREKTNQLQATCISLEAIHDIKSMLRERGNPTKGALFVSPKGKRLSVRFINEAIKKLAEKTFGEEKAKEFKTKSLRSAYNSSLLRAGVTPQEIKDVMMGHMRAGARKDYAFDEETIRQWYQKAFRILSINHGKQAKKDLERIENSLITLSETIAKQKQEITILTDTIAQLEGRLAERDNELASLQYQLEQATQRTNTRLHRLETILKLDKEDKQP